MEIIQKAIAILNNGGIIIFPTDTAFGVGCRIDNKKAIKRLFEIRRRDVSKATSVLVASVEMAQNYLKPIPADVRVLMKNYWPGGLTIVLPCKKEEAPELVRGKGDNLGVRMPENEAILKIIEGVGVPILGPSANFAGEATPYSFEVLDPDFVEKVDFVVKGEIKTKQASTVIDCSKKPWKILREGAVKVEV